MRLNLLTYADSLYAPMQAKLFAHAKSLHCFDEIYTRTREDLVETDFYTQNKYVLDKPRGGGYCLWKPYFIMDTLNRMGADDVLLYMDSADFIVNSEGLRGEMLLKMRDHDILLTAGTFPNKDWTKRDCFIGMFCDEEKYHNTIQIEAGVILIKNTSKSREIVEEWLRYCKVSAIITEDENVFNLPNFPSFKEHRYDQSVLTNVALKRGLVQSDFVRTFITCNVNNPE